MPDLKLSAESQTAVPAQTGETLPALTPTELVRSAVTGPAAETRQAEPATSSTGPSDEPRTGRVNGASASQVTAQLGREDSEAIPGRLYGDTEAFRINLYTPADGLQQGDSSNAAGSEMKAGSELVPLGQMEGSSNEKEIQNPPVADKSGTLLQEGTSVENPAMAFSADGSSKGTAMTQAVQQGRRQLDENGSEEDKPNDKTATNSKPNTEAANDLIGAPAASFLTPARAANGSGAPTGGTRPGDLGVPAETSTSSAAKEMVVRFQGETGGVVSVRLLDQGGQVQVAVRSSDPVTASQLRQEITSLTSSLDRIGWRTDTTSLPTPQGPASHDTRSDSDSPSGQRGSELDWDDSPAKKRYSTAELWDKVLAGQNT